MFPPPPGLRTLLLHPGRRAQRQGVKNENENETKNENETNERQARHEHEGQKKHQKGDDSQGEHAQDLQEHEAAC